MYFWISPDVILVALFDYDVRLGRPACQNAAMVQAAVLVSVQFNFRFFDFLAITAGSASVLWTISTWVHVHASFNAAVEMLEALEYGQDPGR